MESSVANSHASGATVHDYMLGFDVQDDDPDMAEYLAEIALHRIGSEHDISEFVRIALTRGVDEFEQAMDCASAIRKEMTSGLHPTCEDTDVLTLLAQLYRVGTLSTSPETSDGVSFAQPSGQSRNKGKTRKSCESSDEEVPAHKPVKRPRKIAKGHDSPYWAEKSKSKEDGDDRSEKERDAKRKSPKAKKKLRRRLKTKASAIPDVQTMNPEQDAVNQPPRESPKTESSMQYHRDLSVESVDPKTTQRICSWLESTVDIFMEDSRRVDHDHRISNSEEESSSSSISPSPSPSPPPQIRTPKRTAKSPYFKIEASPSPQKPKSPRPPRGTVSSIPFPPLDAPHFGLIQEELAHDPFRLLIAVTLLIKTSGKSAIPVFHTLMAKYPTPEDLAEADTADIGAVIGRLGLGVRRAVRIQQYARKWLEDPPRKGTRYVVKGYPLLPEEQEQEQQQQNTDLINPPTTTTTTTLLAKREDSAWEIGHLTNGAYALDSWRIFCRDVLRKEAQDWKGKGREGEFQPEWMRVLPRDKELRACLRWMWMKEGWLWDPRTGEKVVLPENLRRAVQEGRVAYDDAGDLRILD